MQGLVESGPSWDPQEALENEVAELESRLQEAKQRLAVARSKPGSGNGSRSGNSNNSILSNPSTQSAHHFLLLLSDSALPLGSFAFSSGLESYLAHTTAGRGTGRGGVFRTTTATPDVNANANGNGASSSGTRPHGSFSSFLPLSLSSYASTSLPFVLAAHADPAPSNVAYLDDAQDAAILCAVGRRASVAQGRALLAIWEKSMQATVDPGATLAPYGELVRGWDVNQHQHQPRTATATASTSTDPNPSPPPSTPASPSPPPASAHLAPLFGAISALSGLTAQQTAYIYMLNHAKALVSAAVRAGLFGPYQAQRVLAGPGVRALVASAVDREWGAAVEDAGQRVPAVDLWVGRHEMLYSRIFNS
ncbi:hypothetical protein GGR54DRAFT_42869 [Hypoxylon sp. NC1633]|nr:hypothetical protein GGR54DRAFT_42869 [Hypoxylon sp. NC1633]